MNCEEVKKILIETAGDKIPKEMEEHLSACESCKTLFSDMNRIEQALAEFSESTRESSPLPEGFAAKVRTKVRQRRIADSVRRITYAASTAAVILIAIVFFTAQRPKPVPVVPVTPVAVQTEDDWLKGVELPANDKEKFLLLGKLAGVDAFELKWDSRKGQIFFIAPNPPEYFCGKKDSKEAEKRFEQLLAYCFPKIEKITCKVINPGKIEQYMVLR